METATADTRQRILDAARHLIYARSSADVGVAEICAQAGVQKGSFYHFFPSKQALILAVLDAQYVGFKEHFLDRAFDAALAPLARLERFAELVYQFQRHLAEVSGQVLGCPVGNLATEMASHDEPVRRRVEEIFRKVQRHLRRTLVEAVERGELQGIDVDATAQAMFAYFEGVMMMAKTRNDAEVLRSLLPAIAGIRIPLSS